VQSYCPHCNAPTSDAVPRLPVSNYSRLVYVLLTCFLGFYGINGFYLRNIPSGFCKFVLGASATVLLWAYGKSLLPDIWIRWIWSVPFMIAVIWNGTDLVLGVMGRATDGYGSPVIRWWKEKPMAERCRWSMESVLLRVVTAAILTATVYYVLFFSGAAIASQIIPSNISQGALFDERCDIGHERAQYEVNEEGHKIYDFCYWHAVLYDLATRHRTSGAPFEIRLFTQWSFLMVSLPIGISVAWWRLKKLTD
jgi:hypothetical protein